MVFYESKRKENGEWKMFVTFTEKDSKTIRVPSVPEAVFALIDAPLDTEAYMKKDPKGVVEKEIEILEFKKNEDLQKVLQQLKARSKFREWEILGNSFILKDSEED